MTEATEKWVRELALDDGSQLPRGSTPERIASWVQRGWSFLGVTAESHEREKAEIIALVQSLR